MMNHSPNSATNDANGKYPNNLPAPGPCRIDQDVSFAEFVDGFLSLEERL